MQSSNYEMRTNLAIQESKIITSATNGIEKIINAKYEKAS